jgi:hypothetical protein
LVTAQLDVSPTLTEATLLIPETFCGSVVEMFVPLPSCPYVFEPTQYRSSLERIAQVEFRPTEIGDETRDVSARAGACANTNWLQITATRAKNILSLPRFISKDYQSRPF